MAKIYKFEGYIVAPNDEEIDMEYLLDRYTDGHPFIRTNEYEEFEWDDDLEVNCTNEYWAADKLFCQLAYDRANKKLREVKKIWKQVFYTITPGGDPLWECPLCHNGRHVYGVEEIENYTHICRDCGAELVYPWEVE